MNVLVACEFSGIVREAFRKRGHNAWSCDLLPTEIPGPHFQEDCLIVMNAQPWDLMIAHPPCTYLSYAGTAHWNKPGRTEKRKEAMDFFMECWNAPIKKVCVENPLGLPCQEFRKPDQVINPYDFGEPVRKRTCLWLRGLPILFRADDLFAMQSQLQPVPPPAPIYVGTRIKTGKPKARYETDCAGRKMARRIHWTEPQSNMTADEQRRKARSRSFEGIAQAMAEQWG